MRTECFGCVGEGESYLILIQDFLFGRETEDSFSGFMRRRFSVLQGLRVVFQQLFSGEKSYLSRFIGCNVY